MHSYSKITEASKLCKLVREYSNKAAADKAAAEKAAAAAEKDVKPVDAAPAPTQ